MKKVAAFILIILIIYLIGPYIMWERSRHQNSVFYDGECVTVDSVWLQEHSSIERPYQFLKTSDGKIRMVSQPKYRVGDTICH
jgi:hypothetical protein